MPPYYSTINNFYKPNIRLSLNADSSEAPAPWGSSVLAL